MLLGHGPGKDCPALLPPYMRITVTITLSYSKKYTPDEIT